MYTEDRVQRKIVRRGGPCEEVSKTWKPPDRPKLETDIKIWIRHPLQVEKCVIGEACPLCQESVETNAIFACYLQR